jgi:hypothetical protein
MSRRRTLQSTPAALAANRANALKFTGPRLSGGKEHSLNNLKLHFGRLLGVPEALALDQQPGAALDRKTRFTPVRLRPLGLANACRPTVSAETPGKHEMTSTTVSWNVQSNQRHGSKRGARA